MITTDTYAASALMRREALEIYAEELEIPCDVCGCMMPPDEVCRLGNRQLCDDCFVDTCNALYEKHSKAFMDYKIRRYLESHETPLDSDELPVNYWLSGCSKEERAHILELACVAAEKSHGVGYDEGWKQAYCLEDPEWAEFVTEQENMS